MAAEAPAPRAVSHARVLRIAVPIVVSNATIPLLGAVDTGVVGQMGEAAPIGAVGLGAIIITAVYWVFGFLRMGTTGLAAQAEGAGDGGEAARGSHGGRDGVWATGGARGGDGCGGSACDGDGDDVGVTMGTGV